MKFYDPSYALQSPLDDFVPFVAWDTKIRATMDAKIAEPIKDRDSADRHTRYAIREMLTKEMERSQRTLVSQFFGLNGAGLVNVNQLVEPTEEQKLTTKTRFDREPEWYRLARKIADIRGYLAFLDQLDNRDGFSSRPRTPEGQTTPGLGATSSNSRAATTFLPVGLR